MKGGPSPVTRQRFNVCLEIFKCAAASSTVRSVVVVIMVSFQALARSAQVRSCKTNQNKEKHINPACSPKSGSPKTTTYPPDIHRWIVAFQTVPARTSLANHASARPIAIMRPKRELTQILRVETPTSLQKSSAPSQKSTDPSRYPIG